MLRGTVVIFTYNHVTKTEKLTRLFFLFTCSFFAVGVAEADSSSQDALGLSKLGGQAEKNRKMQKK